MIQQQVNYDASDRDVQPHWKCPTRNRLVPKKVATFCPSHCNDHQGDDNDGQKRVRGENREINWPSNSLPSKSRNAMMLVIYDVGNQEQHRGRKRRNLAVTMCSDSFAPNKTVTT